MKNETEETVKVVYLKVNADERDKFLTGNPMPKNQVESYIWFSFENSLFGMVSLFADELVVAAEMARAAGLDELALRMEAGGRD